MKQGSTRIGISKTRRRINVRKWAPLRPGRIKCRLCGRNEAKRFCPAEGTQICPSCCLNMRGQRAECSTCKYNLVNMANSRQIQPPEPKFFEAYMSDSEKSGLIELAVAWERRNGRLEVLYFLLDFWKRGMESCIFDADISKEEFQNRTAFMGGKASKKINLNEGKKLVKHAITISEQVGTPIPWDYQRWKSLLGDMSPVPPLQGSLFKCARCGAELSKPVVEVMKKHAQLENAHFYMVCERCAGEFED